MIENRKRIVVKAGSSVFVHEGAIATDRLTSFFRVLHDVQRRGNEIILVLSGAVASGMRDLPNATKQACAAWGQLLLTAAVAHAAHDASVRCALFLLRRLDIVDRKRYLTLQKTLGELLVSGYIPFLNENDATAIPEAHDFPDNDHLSAILAISMRASHIFLLTNVAGIYTGNPNIEEEVQLIPVIENVNAPLLALARGEHSPVGRGGMVGKLNAARLATAAGIPVHIFDGVHPEYLLDILSGENRGTFCKPRAKHALTFSDRERWILSAHNTGASVRIDDGAVTALQKRKSLLAVGVQEVFGTFQKHDVVEIVDHAKETVAMGCAEINSDALQALHSAKEKAHGIKVVHANNLILLQ